MKLLFDHGNSFLKWAKSDHGFWETGRIDLHSEARLVDRLDELFRMQSAPTHSLVCSVGNKVIREQLLGWIQDRWSIVPFVVAAEKQACGVSNAYVDPDTLGSDRWAALIAVRNRHQAPACIIDCGTAITVDLLDDTGVFHGGVIFPGLAMARDSLAAGTAGLSTEPDGEIDCLARSTASAIASGTLLEVVGAIKHLVDCHCKTLGRGVSVYLTGGDSKQVAGKLDIPCVLVEDLVLQGLDVVAEQRV